MCANDGETLSAFDLFADMTVDYLCWMRKNGVRFHLFGPLNETDFRSTGGTLSESFAYRSACRSIETRLNETGLEDVQLVVAEQGDYNLDYVTVLLEDELLRDRIGVIGMHAYSDFHTGALLDLASEKAPAARCWMTEFGDLDQDASREDRIAWVCMERLFRLLTDGMHGAMLWDAFDNYHDHDDAWTTFGLLQNAWDLYIPKKRYFALKHLFRYVRPGFRRIAAYASLPEIPVLAFQGRTPSPSPV